MEKFYTVDEVANILNVASITVRRYIREGKLGHIKIGGSLLRITEEQLHSFINGGGEDAKGK